jgi:hypothetical protein
MGDGATAKDSTGADTSSQGDVVIADTNSADSSPRDAHENDSSEMDTAVTDTSLPPCFDGVCPDAQQGLECEVLADGSAVLVDGSPEILYITDGGGCPDGDQVII